MDDLLRSVLMELAGSFLLLDSDLRKRSLLIHPLKLPHEFHILMYIFFRLIDRILARYCSLFKLFVLSYK